jgi:hypothetical protein
MSENSTGSTYTQSVDLSNTSDTPVLFNSYNQLGKYQQSDLINLNRKVSNNIFEIRSMFNNVFKPYSDYQSISDSKFNEMSEAKLV